MWEWSHEYIKILLYKSQALYEWLFIILHHFISLYLATSKPSRYKETCFIQTRDSYNSSAFYIGLLSAGSLLTGTTRAQGQLLPRNTRVTAEEQAHAGSYAAVMPTAGSIQAHILGALVHLVWCSGQRYDGLNGM